MITCNHCNKTFSQIKYEEHMVDVLISLQPDFPDAVCEEDDDL